MCKFFYEMNSSNISNRKKWNKVYYIEYNLGWICKNIYIIWFFVAPTPASSQNILGTPCKDTNINGSDQNKWFYSRGKGSCTTVDMHYLSLDNNQQSYQIVYTFQVYNL